MRQPPGKAIPKSRKHGQKPDSLARLGAVPKHKGLKEAMKAADTAAKHALELASGLLCAAKKWGELNDELIAEVKRLSERELEAAQIITNLLAASETTETKMMLLELRPKAQRFLSAQKAARTRKATERARTESNIFKALENEIRKKTPKRARTKIIASDLKLTRQYVGRVIKRIK